MSLLYGRLTRGGLLEGRILLGGIVQEFGGLAFYAPLETTLVPLVGNSTPSFIRNGTAAVTDFEGVINTANLGGVRFEGARRVENLVNTTTEDASSSEWSTQLSTKSVVAGPDKPGTAGRCTPTTQYGNIRFSITPAVVGHVYRCSATVKVNSGNTGLTINIESGVSTRQSIQCTLGSWIRFSFLYTATSTSFSFAIQDRNASNFGTFDIWHPAVEDVTNQTNTNPSEYVSRGVLPAPYYGANADGVKYLSYQNGNTVTNNVVTEAHGEAIPDATLKGYLSEGQRTNLALYSNNFSNAAWVKSNLTQSSGTLTATAANGTLLQTVTSTSQAHTFSIQIKRKTGTGDIAITLDNGVTWTTKTITASWAKFEVTQTLANPVFGIRIATSGDEIDVRYGQLESASFSSSVILTTSASVTRNADSLKYLMLLPNAGTIYAEVSTSISNVNSGIVSKSLGVGPLNYNSDTGISFIDGTNMHVLTYGQPFSTGIRKIAARWSSSAGTMKLFKDGGASSEGAYNGAFSGGSEILIGQNNFFGCIRNVKIWNRVLSDTELMSMTS